MTMALLMDRLNPAQKEAVTTLDTPLRIIAGAGSGKTSVLMARIEYLIKECGVYPNRIMAITFTNKATREMKERLERACPIEGTRVRISTIHSLCARILREDAKAAGYPQNFTILDADDQKAMLKRIYDELKLSAKEYSAASILSIISANKMAHVTPKAAEEYAYDTFSRNVVKIYERYQGELDRMKMMDFDDLLLITDKLLREDAAVREKWQNRLDFIHVDEFQDVDPVQYSIVRSLVREDAILAVVGDPDQTIYTWRGASVNIILDFEKDFPNSKTIILDQNYRSCQPILDASNALIANNTSRIKKDLFSTRKGTTPVVLFEGYDEEAEASYTAQMIRRIHTMGYDDRKSVPYSDFAILYRSNYLSRSFEKELIAQQIPYRLFGGVRFFERKEIKDVIAYMNLLRKPDPDDPAFMSLNVAVERIINVPSRKLGKKFVEQLRAESEERGINELAVLRDPKTIAPKKAKLFTDVVDKLEAEYKQTGLEGVVQAVLDTTGYQKLLDDDENENRAENVDELVRDIEMAIEDNPDLDLETYLQDISLYTSREEQDAADAVTLMTVHAAKGTEYPVVFVGGVNEKLFPSERALLESGKAGLEEERRLMYVAMTRAQDRLFVTWNNGYSYQTGTGKFASRFIAELPEEQFATMKRPGPVPEMSDTEKEKTRKISPEQKIKELLGDEAPRKKAARTLSERARHTRKKETFRKGDHVVHNKFGEGEVLVVSGTILEIQFDEPHGHKKIDSRFVTKA